MAAPLPTRNILVLVSALLAGTFFAIHGLVQPPWDLVVDQAYIPALGVWLAAPVVLAGAALTVGGVRPDSGRSAPFDDTTTSMLAVLIPVATLATVATIRKIPSIQAADWAVELLVVAPVVGIGLALTTLFWQGVVELRLGKTWPAAVRALVVTTLATAVWLPFWIRSETAIDAHVFWTDLALLSLMAAILSELGISMRILAPLVGLTATGAVYLGHAPFF